MAMASFAIFCRALLALNAAALPHLRLALPVSLRHRLLRDSAILMVLGASALFHAVAVPNIDANLALAAAGFVMWVAGVALLLLALMAGRFPTAASLAAQLVEAAAQAFF